MATLCPTCGVELPSSTNACPRCAGRPVADESAAAPDPWAGRVVGGRYRLLRRLGQGGMGVVFEAEHLSAGQKVAVKFLHPAFSADPEIVRRFRNEARSYAQITHPHAIQLHDFGQDDEGNLYISMEYLEGCDLKRTLAREGRLRAPDALDVVLQVADVLGTAHARGIVHRDLKPENVMLTRELRGYHVKVLDFGLAHLADSGTQLTAPGMICGTPRYMAPEQAEGSEIDHRVDVYALGLVLYECLTGLHPFDSPSVSETLRKQRTAPVPLLADVAPDRATPALDAAIQRATAKDREQRFGSMLDFARALSDLSPGAPAAEAIDDFDSSATVARAPSRALAGEPPASPIRLETLGTGSASVAPTAPDSAGLPTDPFAAVGLAPDATAPRTPRPAPAEPPGSVPEPIPHPVATTTAPVPSPRGPSRAPAAFVGLALLVAAAIGVWFFTRTPESPAATAPAAAPDPRARLDGLYRENGEPPPPAACRESTAAGLARLTAAAPGLRDSAPAAAAALEALEGSGGSSPESAYLLAKARSLADRPVGAALQAALACPGFAAAENLAANLALEDGRLEEAERHYGAAVLAAPGFVKARFNRAVLKFQQGRIEEAIGLLAALLEERPDHADAHYALALIRERKAEAARKLGDAALGDEEAAAAKASYCRALELGNRKAAAGCVR